MAGMVDFFPAAKIHQGQIRVGFGQKTAGTRRAMLYRVPSLVCILTF
jgi:hypothetical protein